MDFVKLKRMRGIFLEYISSFNSAPSGANKSRLLSQLDMLEEILLDEKENIENSSLDTEDINNLIKQKSKLESVLQSFTDIDSDSAQREKFQESLDDFGYELRVSEMKLRGIDVDPSEFREARRRAEEKEEKEGEGESGSKGDSPLELQKAMG